ncbi:MAG TPA: hypothetical protein DDZ43_02815 [Hyphomonadaceae bacterium]|nr:hypothetical protein [Ponticaulis sp.]HBH90771.1 hypothetical protein [Hyphomonadaceae bacterium]HBJ91787.1 hypothetical protein [Hyphomonadaceae bacterium]
MSRLTRCWSSLIWSTFVAPVLAQVDPNGNHLGRDMVAKFPCTLNFLLRLQTKTKKRRDLIATLLGFVGLKT